MTTAPAGAAAREVLGRRLDELRGGSVLSPAVVICHTPTLAVGLRRALGRRPQGVAGVDFTTVNRFIERLATEDLVSARARVATKPEMLAAIRSELKSEPGLFGRVAEHRTTEERLAAFHQELLGLQPEVLDRMAGAATGLSIDAIRVTRAAVDRLGPAAGGDRLLSLALARLERTETGRFGPILLFQPEPTRPYEGRMIQALARRTDCEVIVATTGVDAIDKRHYRRLAGWSIQFGTGDREEGRGLEWVRPDASSRRSTVLEVTDPEEEVRAALRDLSAHASAGVPLDEMAVLYAGHEPYASLLVDHLRAAGLPYSGPGHRRLGVSLAGRTLRRLLSLAADGLERGAVITVLGAAPIDDGEGREVPVAVWNRLSRQAGVIEGDHWLPRLAELAGGLDDERGKQATLALAAFVEELAERLRPPTERTWSAWSRWALDLLERYLLVPDQVRDGGTGGEATDVEATTLERFDRDRARPEPSTEPILPSVAWPADETAALDLVRRMVAGLAQLDEIGRPPTLDAFESTVASELTSLRIPGRSMGHGVHVGPVDSVAGLDFERITVVGLVEGVYPRTPREDSLLPDQLRAQGGGLLAEKSTVTDVDARMVALVAASSRRPALLLTSRGDLRSNRSRTWPRILDPLVDNVQTLDSHHKGLVDHGRPLSEVDFGLRSLIGHVDGDSPVNTHELAAADPVLAANLERVLNRGREEVTRHAGRVPAGRFDPTEHLLSPTALETYASCPRKYLFQRVLRLGEDDRPERIDEITARDRGTLVHRVLERFVADALAADEVPDPDHEWSPEQRAHLFDLLEQEIKSAEARGVTGGQVKTRLLHRSLINEMHGFLERDNLLRFERRSTPIASEFSFGLADSSALEGLWAGRRMQLRGSVDRVDLTEDGGVLVIDYKGGSGSAFRGMEDNPLDDGRRLQLPLYARAVAERLECDGARTGLYWLTKMDEIKEMVLNRDLEDELELAVGAALDGIGNGVFPGVPGDVVGWPRLSFENCRYCDFDRICPTDRQSEWERVRGDSALTPIDRLLRRLDVATRTSAPPPSDPGDGRTTDSGSGQSGSGSGRSGSGPGGTDGPSGDDSGGRHLKLVR